MGNTSAQKSKNKAAAKAAIEACKEGIIVSPAQRDNLEKIAQKAKELNMGSVLDDLQSTDLSPSRRR